MNKKIIGVTVGTTLNPDKLKSIESTTINESGELLITYSNGQTVNVGNVIGQKGDTGDQGIQGEQGETGEDGVGIQSVIQTTTSDADNGENILKITLTDGQTALFKVYNGSKGADGEKGEKGDAGEKGSDGANGINGEDGADGKSAYEYAQDGGYTGTEEEFSTKLAQDIALTHDGNGNVTISGVAVFVDGNEVEY